MNKCYWCGDPATLKVSGCYICQRHTDELFKSWGLIPYDVKFCNDPTHTPQGADNLKNNNNAPQYCEDTKSVS